MPRVSSFFLPEGTCLSVVGSTGAAAGGPEAMGNRAQCVDTVRTQVETPR